MKTVIITGGSRGIGAAAVRAFCARGDRVAFLYEKEDEKAQAVAAETGAQACFSAAEITSISCIANSLTSRMAHTALLSIKANAAVPDQKLHGLYLFSCTGVS